jgi:hypothetical protein
MGIIVKKSFDRAPLPYQISDSIFCSQFAKRFWEAEECSDSSTLLLNGMMTIILQTILSN